LCLGASRPTDFDEHVAALAHYDDAAAVMAPVERRLRAELEKVHGADWCARWWEGLPEHDALPGDINVIETLRLWTFAKALDLVDWGKMRYNLLGTAGHWFPGLKPGEVDAAELAACLARSPFADRIPSLLREAHALLDDAPRKRLSQE
jgi:predicted aldo/keto reductase-like oxidoreductase